MWDTNPAIQDQMEVLGSCGQRVGFVDRVEGGSIKLTRSDENAQGQHHDIPLAWVTDVATEVHLNKSCEEALQEWHLAPVQAGGG